jgi:hypothetical protein
LIKKHLKRLNPLFHHSGRILHGRAVSREPGAGRSVAAPGAGSPPPAGDSEDGGGPGSCSGGEAVPAAAAMGDGPPSGGIGGGLSGGGAGGRLTGRRRGKGSGRAMASLEGLRAVFDPMAVERVVSCV